MSKDSWQPCIFNIYNLCTAERISYLNEVKNHVLDVILFVSLTVVITENIKHSFQSFTLITAKKSIFKKIKIQYFNIQKQARYQIPV